MCALQGSMACGLNTASWAGASGVCVAIKESFILVDYLHISR